MTPLIVASFSIRYQPINRIEIFL